MCGICGFIKINENAPFIDGAYLKAMNDQMVLRGPDGGNEWLDSQNRVGLGHRRLSIIDLSESANQPMSNENETIVVVFNGEIYNHAEIRKELESLGGYVWKTDHSDTEVIIHSYEQWGINCLDKFRGMFTIAIWDMRCETLYLVRDRIGIKPLYYTLNDGVLTFASEINAILKVIDHTPSVNKRAMYDYLSFLASPCEETLFEGINKLRPGTYIRVTRRQLTTIQYWDVWDNTRPEIYNASEEDIKRELLTELRRAVNLRKISDVPVGIFLSGGVDSSTNAALFSDGETEGVVKAFCVGSALVGNRSNNETPYAREMAEYCKASYYERLLSQDDLNDYLTKMARMLGEPIADQTCVLGYYVAKLARDNGVIVSQVGEGSDELFWGYRRWKAYLQLAKMNDRFPVNYLKKQGLNVMKCCGLSDTASYELLRRATVRTPIFWSGAEAFYETEKQQLISGEMKKELDGYTSFEAIRPTWETFKEKAWEQSHLNWMSYADLRHRLPELLLMRVDKTSMAVSLECRVPFLDHKFVELALSIPEKVKTKNGTLKYILKETVRGLIPDEVIDRKKQGFAGPLEYWLTNGLVDVMRQEIKLFTKETGYFDKKYVDDMLSKGADWKRMWCLYSLALWWRTYSYSGTIGGVTYSIIFIHAGYLISEVSAA